MTTQPKRKPGRPLGSPNRTSGALLKPLTIRLTATEHDALVAIGQRLGLKLAAACRWCIAKQVDAQYQDRVIAALDARKEAGR